MSTMDFNELVSGATVRFQVIDNVQYLSIRDFIMVVCEQNSKRAWATWNNLSEERKDELSQKLGKLTQRPLERITKFSLLNED